MTECAASEHAVQTTYLGLQLCEQHLREVRAADDQRDLLKHRLVRDAVLCETRL